MHKYGVRPSQTLMIGDSIAKDVGVAQQTILRDESPAPVAGPDGSRHLVLPRSPCGDVWVRPHWSTAGTTPVFCRNATPTGEIHATLTRDFATVACDPPP